MEDLKESLDQRRRELARLGAGKLGSGERGPNRPGEQSHGEVKDLFLERGFAAKEPEGCGTNGARP